MISNITSKKRELKDKFTRDNFLQKGFTLVEMLAVIIILVILIAIAVFNFGLLSKADGTELNAQSKQVESAVLQNSLANDNRDIAGVPVEYTDGSGMEQSGSIVTRAEAADTLMQGVDNDDFTDANQAAFVIGEIAKDYGLDGDDLVALIRPVHEGAQSNVAGGADVADYYVVVKKSQLYRDDALAHFDGYNDELAGKVFSRDTIVDRDGVVYNGTHLVNAGSDTGAITDSASEVFKMATLGSLNDGDFSGLSN